MLSVDCAPDSSGRRLLTICLRKSLMADMDLSHLT